VLALHASKNSNKSLCDQLTPAVRFIRVRVTRVLKIIRVIRIIRD
jgi:hypothetical protein